MYSNFSCYFEILAALYTSMCLDDILKNVWTPEFYNDLEKELNNQKFEGHEDMPQRMVKEAKEKVDSIKRYMKNRSMFILVITIFIIFLIGFEELFATNDNNIFTIGIINIEMTITTLVIVSSIYLLLFYKLALKRPQNIFISLLCVICITIYISGVDNLKSLYLSYSIHWYIGIILILMTLPILWQLFVLWVFTNGYKVYIRELLKKEKNEYYNIINGNKLPKDYLNELGKSVASSDLMPDEIRKNGLDWYIKKMDDDITKASRLNSVIRIFIFWMLYSIKNSIYYILIKIKLKKPKTLKQS